jgi:hypothetical protein
MKAKLIKTETNYVLEDDKGVVIASTSLKEKGMALSLKNCQSIELGYDLDDLAEKSVKHIENKYGERITSDVSILDQKQGFIRGFQKCLEIMGDKKFTLDDVYTTFIMGRENMESKMNNYVDRIDEPIQWNVYIVMDIGEDAVYAKPKPALDKNDCLILRRI